MFASKYGINEKHLDNIYLNVVFQNNTQLEKVAEYNVTKNQPILDNPSNYYGTVIRFDVPLNSIPLMIMPIVPNQANPNLTPFIFSINASDSQVIYVPDNNLTAPVQNQQTQVVTPYYYVYSFGNVLSAFNTAINAAFVAAGSPGGGAAPLLVFNSQTQLLGFIVSTAFITSGATLSINYALVNYFEGFRINYNSTLNNGTFIFENTGNNGFNISGQTTAVSTPPTNLLVQQDYSAMEYWLSLRKIVLISNTIPVNYEYIPAFDSAGTQTGVTVSIPIFTDFVPNIELVGQSRSIAVYNPSAQYRLVDLLGNTPLYNIDLKINWQDKNGTYYPVFIEPGQQASVKIAFIRKDLFHQK